MAQGKSGRLLVVLFLFVALSSVLNALTPLSSLPPVKSVLSAYGYIWIGTSDGLFRGFDYHTPLTVQRVSSDTGYTRLATISGDPNVWVLGDNGISRLDPSRPFSKPQLILPQTMLPWRVSETCGATGFGASIWVCTIGYVYRVPLNFKFQSEPFRYLDPPIPTRINMPSFLGTAANSLWILEQDTGNDEKTLFRSYINSDRRPSEVRLQGLSRLHGAVLAAGGLWLCTAEGVFRFDGRPRSKPKSILARYCESIHKSKDSVWAVGRDYLFRASTGVVGGVQAFSTSPFRPQWGRDYHIVNNGNDVWLMSLEVPVLLSYSTSRHAADEVTEILGGSDPEVHALGIVGNSVYAVSSNKRSKRGLFLLQMQDGQPKARNVITDSVSGLVEGAGYWWVSTKHGTFAIPLGAPP